MNLEQIENQYRILEDRRIRFKTKNYNLRESTAYFEGYTDAIIYENEIAKLKLESILKEDLKNE